MSFLFHKNTQKTIKWIWGIIAVIITVSMVFAYSGGLSGLLAGIVGK